MPNTPRTELEGRLVDVTAGRIYPARVVLAGGKVESVEERPGITGPFLLPGLVDAHVHIESSMLVPSAFARVAVKFGTVATVSDPHEIANVCGLDGVRYMLVDAERTPFHFAFGAPSCVPAAPFENAGSRLGPSDVAYMLRALNLSYLSEMMNFPGVIHGDPEVHAKLQVALALGKPIDGHAPGLRGEGLKTYAGAGIATDHECFAIDEAREKLALGMKILIREGSAAKNLEELWPLLHEAPERVMVCTDDMHPDSLLEGHLDRLIRRLIAKGVEPMAAIRAATLNPIEHYNLPCGLLRMGDRADCIVVADLERFNVQATYIAGEKVFDGDRVSLPAPPVTPINNFGATPVSVADLAVIGPETVHVIEAIDGQIVTGRSTATLQRDEAGFLLSNPERDIAKIVVLNRYEPAQPAVGFVRGFGLAQAAIASSVAHDSHHIVAVGGDDAALAKAINAVISARGGLSFATVEDQAVLPLPVAGLMSDADPEVVARQYRDLDAHAKNAGCRLTAPYMTLSFMALPVIPSLKMTDKGLFDVETFSSIPLGAA